MKPQLLQICLFSVAHGRPSADVKIFLRENDIGFKQMGGAWEGGSEATYVVRAEDFEEKIQAYLIKKPPKEIYYLFSNEDRDTWLLRIDGKNNGDRRTGFKGTLKAVAKARGSSFTYDLVDGQVWEIRK